VSASPPQDTGWLLALHSSGEGLGVGLVPTGLDPETSGQTRVELFPTGRDLSNRLLACVEEMLPADRWSALRRLAVATGPGGFTSTRLTVVFARTLAQQLNLPLDGISSFRLIARRLQQTSQAPSQPFWLVQDLPRRGTVAGRYGPDAASPGGIAELDAPRLLPGDLPLEGPCLPATALPGEDVRQLLAFSRDAGIMGAPADWQAVLPLYPTSPVRQI
jgi:tRNA threonylcarbamoyl adenosine modification protein YeaZ